MTETKTETKAKTETNTETKTNTETVTGSQLFFWLSIGYKFSCPPQGVKEGQKFYSLLSAPS